MGIKGLAKLIAEKAPNAVKEKGFKAYFGQKVAIDASMSLYQFLIAIRHGGGDDKGRYQNLTSATGEVTSHLQGIFYRTIKLLDNGIKPAFVFDGKAEALKSSELAKRKEKREKAKAQLEEAQEAGRQEDIERFTKSSTTVTQQQYDDVKRLLQLMGLPIVQAPGEAEAQAAALARGGKVYAVATEDMDALTFNGSRLLRNLTFSFAGVKQSNVYEYDLKTVLEELQLNMEQFIDVCILCGCDFAAKLKGIGPTSAYGIIQKFGSIEAAMPTLREKHGATDEWPYKEAQRIFREPKVTDPSAVDLQWGEPNYEGITRYLVDEKGFNADRVRGACDRLKKYRRGATQQRLESFFGMSTPTKKAGDASSSSSASSKKAQPKTPAKRKNMGTLGARGKPKKSARMGDEEHDEKDESKSSAGNGSAAAGAATAVAASASGDAEDDDDDEFQLDPRALQSSEDSDDE